MELNPEEDAHLSGTEPGVQRESRCRTTGRYQRRIRNTKGPDPVAKGFIYGEIKRENYIQLCKGKR